MVGLSKDGWEKMFFPFRDIFFASVEVYLSSLWVIIYKIGYQETEA